MRLFRFNEPLSLGLLGAAHNRAGAVVDITLKSVYHLMDEKVNEEGE